MNFLRRHPSDCQLLWLAALFIILDFPTTALATNLTEQYHLCKTDAQIEALRLMHDLIRVDATPTHAALHPSWPETLITHGINVYSIVTIASKPKSGFTLFFFKGLVPFALAVAWCISFVVAEINGPTAGWISCSMTTAFVAFLNLASYMESDSKGFFCGLGGLLAVLSVPLGIFQFFASFAAMGQRCTKTRLNVKNVAHNITGFGSVAYKVTDTHGCIPFDGIGYLQKGARAHAFTVIIFLQVIYSFYAFCFLLVVIYAASQTKEDTAAEAISLGSREKNAPREENGTKRGDGTKGKNASREEDSSGWKDLIGPNAAFALNTIFLSSILLIYEAVIATKGRPVVVSGNCMLVELDPRLGFLDSEIDNWWKALVGMTGL